MDFDFSFSSSRSDFDFLVYFVLSCRQGSQVRFYSLFVCLSVLNAQLFQNKNLLNFDSALHLSPHSSPGLTVHTGQYGLSRGQAVGGTSPGPRSPPASSGGVSDSDGISPGISLSATPGLTGTPRSTNHHSSAYPSSSTDPSGSVSHCHYSSGTNTIDRRSWQ